MDDNNELATYSGRKEVAEYFRGRADAIVSSLTKGVEVGFIECGAGGMEKLTPTEYLARCMWAASENVPPAPNATSFKEKEMERAFEIGDIVEIKGADYLAEVTGVIHDAMRLFIRFAGDSVEKEFPFALVTKQWREIAPNT